jgi:hypothetical protein
MSGRRLIPAVVIAILLIPAFAACGGPEKPDAELNIRDLAKTLIDGIAFADQMDAASDGAFHALYAVNPDDEAIVDFVLYTSTGATAEEVSVIKTNGAEGADDVFALVQRRISSQKSEFEDYIPNELAKLSDPVLVRSGKYIILCVSNDNASAEKLIEDFIEQ